MSLIIILFNQPQLFQAHHHYAEATRMARSQKLSHIVASVHTSKPGVNVVKESRFLYSNVIDDLFPGHAIMILTAADYTVGWISALPDELAAAEGMLDEEHECLDAQIQDTNSYSYGRIGNHNVVIACLPSGTVGTTAAATVATNMTRTFPNLRFGLMVGVGGGIPHLEAGPEDDIRLGDVVVSTPHEGHGGVIQYDFGKTIQHKEFLNTGSLNRPPAILSTAITRLRGRARRRGYGFPGYIKKMLEENPAMNGIFDSPGSTNDSLFDAHNLHPAGEPDCSTCQGALSRQPRRDPEIPIVHYGLIGSANQVMRNANIRDTIGKKMGILCLEMEAGGLMNDFPCVVIRGICDYCDTHKNKKWQPFAATVAAAYTKELLEHISLPQVDDIPKATDVMVELVKHTAILEETKSKLNTLQHNIDFSILPCVEGAGFNWASGSADNRCHPSTRIELLDQIRNWFEDSQSESIYWLDGMAGTGKTTIAREICYRFAQNNELAASFFFKKGEGDRGNVTNFCSTIAIQLAQSLKGFDIILAEILQKSRDAIRLSFQEQFQKLIAQPLGGIEQSQKVLIVIDALDECSDEQDVKRLLILFSKLNGYANLSLKIFVTGRPELYVRLGFARIKTEHVTFKLHNIDQTTIEHDIGTYMDTELARIRDEYNLDPVGGKSLPEQWPGSKRLKRLLTLATPLFIYGATICRFIGSNNSSDPEGKLERMLASRQSHGMESIYLPILYQLLQGCDASERLSQIQEFNAMIGPLVILFEPLTTSAFAEILALNRHRFEILLHSLHSVLMVPEDIDAPIQLLHLSFRDFLVDPQRKDREFAIDEGAAHITLMDRCVIFLKASKHLKQNICELEHPGSHRAEISTDTVHQYLPPEVQYTCVYWLRHFEARQGCPFNADLILSFLKEHFLHWLEVLSLLGRITETARTLRRIIQTTHLSVHVQLYEFLNDAERFLSMFGGAVSDYPLQLYSSALVFTPKLSVIRMNFELHIPPYFVPTSAMRKEWPAQHLTIEPHTSGITSVAFSADARYLATASHERLIKIWDMSLGLNYTTMDVDCNTVWAMSFSPDGSVIACENAYGTVQLYDTASGIPLVTIQAQYKVNSITFSNNGELIAVGTADKRDADPLLGTWHCHSGELFQSYVGAAQDLNYLAFSKQDVFLAAGGLSGISIWDVARGTQIKFFDATVTAMAASPTLNLLFVVVQDEAEIQICSLDMADQSMQKLSVINSNATRWRGKAAISPTGEYLALNGTTQGEVELWSTSAMAQVASFQPHTSLVRTLHFSGSDYLVTRALDGIVKGWKISDLPAMAKNSLLDKISIFAFTLSGDGKRCAWLYLDERDMWIQIWDIQKAKPIVNTKVKIRIDADQFSLSYHGTRLVWRASERSVRVWEVSSKSLDYNLEFTAVVTFAFSPVDHIIAFGKYDVAETGRLGFIQVWDLSSRSCLNEWDVLGSEEIETIGFSRSGRYLAWCFRSIITIANLDSNKLDFLQTDFIGKSLAFHGDEKHIVIPEFQKYSGTDYHLKLRPFEISTKAELETIKTNAKSVSNPQKSMSFDPSGTHLETDFGVFTFQKWKPRGSLTSDPKTETFWVKRNWIRLRDKKFLWIPVAYRSLTWISAGRSLALLAPDSVLCILNLDAEIDQDKYGSQLFSDSSSTNYELTPVASSDDRGSQAMDLKTISSPKVLSVP